MLGPSMPMYYYFAPVLVVALLVWQFAMRRKGLADTKYATVGALAQRLGLSVVQGDPKLNLYYLSKPNGNYKRTVELSGMPNGRPLHWEFTDGSKKRDFLVLIKITTTWGCYFTARVGVPFPAFEVTLRNPNEYLVPQPMQPNLPEAYTGDHQIDSHYRIAIADPRWAPALLPVLRTLQSELYVHLVGSGDTIMIPLTRYALPYFVHAAELNSYALEVLACSFEGKQPPAFVPPPPAAA
jgi:hypothetical protein